MNAALAANGNDRSCTAFIDGEEVLLTPINTKPYRDDFNTMYGSGSPARPVQIPLNLGDEPMPSMATVLDEIDSFFAEDVSPDQLRLEGV